MRETPEKQQLDNYLELISKLPVMAHAIDDNGVVIGVSNFWLNKMGHKKGDVIGRKSTSFLTEESRKYAEEKAFPEFLAKGFIENTPFQFVKNDASIIEVLLSANSIYDQHGFFLCSLAIIVDITKEKRTQIALEKSEQNYRELLEFAQEGIWVIDEREKTRFVNPCLARMLGYTAEEMIGRSLFDFMDEQGVTIATNNIRRRREGIGEQHDFEFLHKNGKKIHTTLAASPVFNAAGEYNGSIASVLDVTDRRHTERIQSSQLQLIDYASTHSSQELLTRFLDEAESLTESAIGFYHFYNDNEKVLSLKTWSSNTFDKLCKAERSNEHYPLEKAGVWADCARERKPIVHNDYEKLPHKQGLPEGHVKITRELVVPVIRGNEVVAVLGVGNKATDYTEYDVETTQVLAELAWESVSRKLAEESLRSSQAKLENLLQTIQAGVIVHDVMTNTIVDFNSASLETLGLTGEQILDKSTVKPDWDFVSEDGVRLAVDDYPVNIVRRTKKPLLDYIIGIETPSRQDPLWVIVKASPQFDENGELRQVIVSSMDISELKKTQSQLRKKDQQLLQAQKMESIGNLAGGIAHDFNNILSAILGFTELALDDAESGSSQEEDLKEVCEAGNRAKELVKQILAFARQSGEELEPVRPSDIILETLKLLRPSTPSSIQITTNIDSSSYVVANPTQLHQVVLNLCNNAIYSMQVQGEILEINVRDATLSDNEKFIELSISDNGPGIRSEIIDRIFDPYYTTKGIGEGTGMGLAMVKGIVESWGGQISVISIPEKMTTFTVILPISSQKESIRPADFESYPRGSGHILFIDDEPSIARTGSRLLESLGYSVTVRTSSVEALEIFREKSEEFDLVISDMTMPYMTGDELSFELRRIKHNIPIIICTGYSNKINEERARQIGINAFAYKPFTKSDFARTIKKVLEA